MRSTWCSVKSVIAQRLVVDEILPIAQIGAADIKQAEEMTLEERKHAAQVAGSAGVSYRAPDTQEIDTRAAAFATRDVDYIYEQPAEQLLGKLLPRYVETQILRAMLESSAAEHAARMTAMESATKNAGDVIEALTLHMNKVRQAAITKEIIEIVSGASYGA